MFLLKSFEAHFFSFICFYSCAFDFFSKERFFLQNVLFELKQNVFIERSLFFFYKREGSTKKGVQTNGEGGSIKKRGRNQ